MKKKPARTKSKPAPKLTIVRDAKPEDKGFIGHFDQVMVRDRKGHEQLMRRQEVAA